MQTYILFHLNLFFSSVEESDRKKIIKNCYEPLLDICNSFDFKIGIEASGLTIKEVNKLSPNFLISLKKSILDNQIEFIGSGYSQSIGPLIPYEVNIKNIAFGKKIYKEFLDVDPKIALINEMTFSKSMPDMLIESGYEAIIMDLNNILDSNELDICKKRVSSLKGKSFDILWSDFNLFQKFQQYIYGDISHDEYKNFLFSKLEKGIFPIYSNDAEIFDFRPGRFFAERPRSQESEWQKIYDVLEEISKSKDIEILSPSEIIKRRRFDSKVSLNKIIKTPTHLPVKKQPKYNLSRWSVTGINDPWLNSICHKITDKVISSPNKKKDNYWKKISYLWSSDFRTHITKRRWNNLENEVKGLLTDLKIKDNFYSNSPIKFINKSRFDKFENFISKNENILEIDTKKTKVSLNLRRGLAIDQLSFSSNNFNPIIGTIKQGYFDNISYSADFYSANFVADLPLERTKISDLSPSDPYLRLDKNVIKISSKINSPYGEIRKEIGINVNEEEVHLNYDFFLLSELFGSVNAGIITFLDEKKIRPNYFKCKNGGKDFEKFDLNKQFDHSQPASFLVSSSSGLGCTDGTLIFGSSDQELKIKWDPKENYTMPKIQNIFIGNRRLTRVFFSLQEVDDTKKNKTKIGNLRLTLTT